MIRHCCHLLGGQRCRIRIQRWWLCLPGPPKGSGSSGNLHRVPNPLGWTIGFSGCLGVARAGSQGPTPVPFFPEVHDELTGSWTAPFTARNRSSGSSSLTTLDGGAARGYMEIPLVERSVAMQLCPNTAATWRGNPLLPSRACRYSSALTGSAYAACGEAASALHAMALLQVHQAKALVESTHRRGRPPAAAPTLAQQLQQPPAKQRRGAGRRAAALPVQAPVKPGGKRKSKRPWDGRPGDGGGCSSGDGERTTPSPGGGPGGESFVSFFPATGLTVSGTQKLDKRAVSSISGSPEGLGSCGRASLESHSPSSLASEQLWAVRACDQSYYSRTLCQDAGKCCAHSDPVSDRHRDARTESLRSPSLPHRGYVGGSVGATCTVSGSLVSASQSVLLAPSDHQTRLCDSVCPASSQVQGHPLHFSEGGRCSCLARRDRSPPGEGCDRAGPSSRYEDGVLQPLLHCTQKRRWVETNLGSVRP